MKIYLLIYMNTWFYLQLVFLATHFKFKPSPLFLCVIKECRHFWHQKLLTQIQWKLKKNQSTCKISTTVKFVFVILISIFLRLQFFSHHFEKHKNAHFFLPVVVNFLSYWHRHTEKEHIHLIFLLAIILYKITLHFSVTL